MSDVYLTYMPGGRWAISRTIADKSVYLIQDSYMDDEADIYIVLQALGITTSLENLNRYFSTRKGKGRCPTLELLELFLRIGDSTRSKDSHIGV